jgi:hypothetical protein
MNAELRERIQGFSDEFLVRQYTAARDEYTPEAIEVMEHELKARNIDPSAYAENAGDDHARQGQRTVLSRDDFTAFEHRFERTDLLVAEAVLRDLSIPFLIETSDSDAVPLQTEADRLYTLFVHKDSAAKAHEALDEHFDKAEGAYRSKYTDIKDRLRALSWHDVHFSEDELEEEVHISYSEAERTPIAAYAKKLMREADQIEQNQGRVLFYYDNLEGLVERLEENRDACTRAELLALLETLQVYCDDPAFPGHLEPVAEQLMQFAMAH